MSHGEHRGNPDGRLPIWLLPMILPAGEYRYEIRRAGELVAIEETNFDGRKLTGLRQSPDGSNRNEIAAEITAEGLVYRLNLHYVRGPFSRSATYEAAEDFLRGSVTALGSRNVVTAKLGRFREIDGDFVWFRALTIAHLRARGQTRWTGRVATIDSATLVASSHKQSARASDPGALKWVYEARMGDSEEIEIDAHGRVLVRRDNRGGQTLLKAV